MTDDTQNKICSLTFQACQTSCLSICHVFYSPTHHSVPLYLTQVLLDVPPRRAASFLYITQICSPSKRCCRPLLRQFVSSMMADRRKSSKIPKKAQGLLAGSSQSPTSAMQPPLVHSHSIPPTGDPISKQSSTGGLARKLAPTGGLAKGPSLTGGSPPSDCSQ